MNERSRLKASKYAGLTLLAAGAVLASAAVPGAQPTHAAAAPATGQLSGACTELGTYIVGQTYNRIQPLKRHGLLALTSATSQIGSTGTGRLAPVPVLVAPVGAWHGQLTVAAYAGCGAGMTAGTVLVTRQGAAAPLVVPHPGGASPLGQAAVARGVVGPVASIVGISGAYEQSAPMASTGGTQASAVTVRAMMTVAQTTAHSTVACLPGGICRPSARVVTSTRAMDLTGSLVVNDTGSSVTLFLHIAAAPGVSTAGTIVLLGTRATSGGAPRD